MNNSPVMKISDSKADTYFLVAAISLVTNSVMVNLANAFDKETASGKVITVFCGLMMIASGLASYIATIKGFGFVNKKCMLDDNNPNYYLGRKLQRLAVASVFVTIILTIVTSVIFVVASQYIEAEALTAADRKAYDNLLGIVAIVSIITVIFDITLPYMIYLWNIHKASGGDNFALLVVIIMVVQIIIASLNSIYAARGNDNSFLATFSILLDVLEGIALMLFFFKRKQALKE